MDPIYEGLKLLDGQIKDIADELWELYQQLISKGDSQKQGRLQWVILKLETEKEKLNARCEAIEKTLLQIGMPFKD